MGNLGKRYSYLGAYNHFSMRLKERFNEEMDFYVYFEKYILIRELPKKYNNKKVKYKIGDRIYVYAINKHYEVPITVYEIDRRNKNRPLKTIEIV